MDTRALERDRIDACVFMTMTRDGPVSMCTHNAKRDSFILQPIRFYAPGGPRFWQPLTGTIAESDRAPEVAPETHPLKRLKGRVRRTMLRLRRRDERATGVLRER